MKSWISRTMHRWILPLCLSALFVCTGRAQSAENTRVDVFMGAELHYRDIFHNKVYEVLVNLTPGVKWYMGNRWQLAGQVIVPVYNDYGDRYKKVRLNMAVLSKEWDWHRKLFLKVSGGLFAMERYGLACLGRTGGMDGFLFHGGRMGMQSDGAFDGSCRGTCLSEWGEYGIPGARRPFPV